MSEHAIMREVRVAADERDDVLLWRNNVGKFWTIPNNATCAHCGGNLLNGRALRGATISACGLGLGSADLVGLQVVTITDAMIGQRLGRFIGLEVKTPTGRVRPEQALWRDVVCRRGGFVETVRSAQDARAALEQWGGAR